MKVITPACSSPEFIRIQKAMLDRWMPVGYQFIVFNDAKAFPDKTNQGDVGVRDKIEEVCRALGIRSILMENQHHAGIHSASWRHTDTLRNMMKYMLEYPDAYLMIDSDMFPIGPIDFERYRTKTGAFVLQTRGDHRYAWPNLFYLDTRNAPDLALLSWDLAPECDTGGASEAWIRKHGHDAYWIPHHSSCNWTIRDVSLDNPIVWAYPGLIDFLESDPRNQNGYWCELYDSVFFHYRGGSNWNNEGSLHTTLVSNLEQLLLG
jgi:hypothetical protein